MPPPTPIVAARRFCDLVLTADAPSLSELSQSLDALVLAAQQAAEPEPTTDVPDPPPRDDDAITQAIQARFPDFGVYAVSDPLDLNDPPMTGDTIDDLLDIFGDPSDALWRHDRYGLADAQCDLAFSYRTHWGHHFRELALHLHTRQFG